MYMTLHKGEGAKDYFASTSAKNTWGLTSSPRAMRMLGAPGGLAMAEAWLDLPPGPLRHRLAALVQATAETLRASPASASAPRASTP